MNPKLLAIYFPQFHNIPENNVWWGKDFTDWELVRKAKPLFDGHYQPRVPLNNNYYNPTQKEVWQWQIDTAKQYHIHGFMIYHYWFDGKLLLEKPAQVLLNNPDLDIPFCLSWANAGWTRQWTGNNEILIRQRHTPDQQLWTEHFKYLLPFLKDRRAIKIDDKPLFAIYAPNLVHETKQMFDLWNELAKQNGLKGIHFMAMKNYEFANPSFLSNYDSLLKFQPREANTSPRNPQKQRLMSLALLRLLPETIQNKIAGIRLKLKSTSFIDTPNIWNCILNEAYNNPTPQYDLDIFESAFWDWDNTARYGRRATVYSHTSFEDKQAFMQALYDKAQDNDSEYIVFNAWNEWSECAYLEPDNVYQYRQLEIIKHIF